MVTITQHDMGWKWYRKILKSYYENISHSLEQQAIFNYTEHTIVINLPEE